MNKKIIPFLIVLIPIILNSFEFRVTHFKEDINDSQAISRPQKDQNGKFCSVIRIDTNIESEIWLSDINIVKKTKVSNSLYYFYLSSNEKHLTILAQTFDPLYYKIPVNMNGGKTYSMKLETTNNEEQEREEVIIKFYLNQLPDSILVNKKSKSLDKIINLGEQFLFYLESNQGEHNLGFFKKGYRDIRINKNFEKPEEISINFEQLIGDVTILTIPDSLLIMHNNKEIGFSSIYKYFMEVGDYILHMKYNNYLIPINLNVKDGKNTFIFNAEDLLININILTKQTGVLTLIDSVIIGRTPIDNFRIEPGNHNLTFKYQNWEPSINIVISPENSSFVFDVERELLGTLSIKTIPSKIPIYLEDEYLGKSPIINYKTSIGNHEILFFYNNYVLVDSIEIYNDLNDYTINMQKKFFSNISITTIPQKLKIFLDDSFIGTSPINDYPTFPGSQKVSFQYQNWDIDIIIQVQKGYNDFSFDIENKLIGKLIINTIPDNIKVYCDGKKIGKTPIQNHKTLIGHHKLSFKYGGLDTFLEIYVKGGVNTFNIDVENDLIADVSITTNPNKVQTYIDGKAIGGTPISNITICPGTYILTFNYKTDISFPLIIEKGINNFNFDIENDLLSTLYIKLRPKSYIILNGKKKIADKNNEIYYYNLNPYNSNNIQIYTELNGEKRLSPFRNTHKIVDENLTLISGINSINYDIENDLLSILKVNTERESKIYINKTLIGKNNIMLELLPGNYTLGIKFKDKKNNFHKTLNLKSGINDFYFE
ncbi:MAG: PEGA domain-containing protein [Candidatus Tenebribacter davisii]|nr:PEGA domain-containing protein [Candidatus Tenebribacter davisii]